MEPEPRPEPAQGSANLSPKPLKAGTLHGLLLLTIIIWGLAFGAIKYLEEEQGVGPVELTLQRFLLAGVGFGLLLAGLRRRGPLPRLAGREARLRLVAIAVLGIGGYHLALNYGEQFTTSGTAAIIIAFNPALTFLLAVPLLGERFTPLRAAGLGLALVGVAVLVVWGRGEGLGAANLRGLLVLLLAPLCWASYNIIGKPLFTAHDPLAVSAYFNLLGAALLLPLVRPSLWHQTAALDGAGWAALIFLALASTVTATVLYNLGLHQLPATRVSAYIYLVPVVATAGGVALLGEPVTGWTLAGGAMVLGGVALVQRGGKGQKE